VRYFETYGIDQELLFNWDERVEEETRLGPYIRESRRCNSDQIARDSSSRGGKESIADRLIGFLRVPVVKGVWRVRGCVEVDEVLSSTVSVVIVNLNMGAVDRELLKVWTTMTIELGIKI